MVSMRFLKSIKSYWPDYAFLSLIVVFGLLYFTVYMTPSKAAWYQAMYQEMRVALHGIVTLL